MKYIVVALILAGASSTIASTQSPYMREELNEIKSLSPGEINGLLQGSGMGLAKTAELNQYPGPRHVLDLAEQLHLSDLQIAKTNHVFEEMRENAVVLGKQLVDYERKLETLFSSGRISASKLDSLLLKIGKTKARLRGTHLHAHLEMKKILSPHQIVVYDNLRGYSNGTGKHKHTH
ncbi:MAG: hypothetical protein AAF353_01020 [Pseudomonadota bacterium]